MLKKLSDYLVSGLVGFSLSASVAVPMSGCAGVKVREVGASVNTSVSKPDGGTVDVELSGNVRTN